jgi:hypothetical protein
LGNFGFCELRRLGGLAGGLTGLLGCTSLGAVRKKAAVISLRRLFLA